MTGTEFSTIPAQVAEWSPEEKAFVEATAALFEKTVQKGVLPEPTEDNVSQDIGVLFDALNELPDEDKADEEFVESYIMPVAGPWNDNHGRAPGRLGGFFGTNLLLERIKDRAYQLSVGGVD